MPLNRTSIEYLTHIWNPMTGCENWRNGVCGGGGQEFNCWAKTITGRFPDRYPNGFEPTIYPERFFDPLGLRKFGARIGVCFMGDLFGDWIDPNAKIHVRSVLPCRNASIESLSLKGWIFSAVKGCPQHQFIFLTKCPWNLAKWNPWPDNCWVGASVTSIVQYRAALVGLAEVDAKVKFISFEPLLQRIPMLPPYVIDDMQWVIIGAATKPLRLPELSWVIAIEEVANREGIPVFEKDNRAKLLPSLWLKRGYPKEVKE